MNENMENRSELLVKWLRVLMKIMDHWYYFEASF